MYRRDQGREQERLAAELEAAVAELEAAACPVCGPDREADVPVDGLLPPGGDAVRRRLRRQQRRARRRVRRRGASSSASPAQPGCWLCGSAWLIRLRQRFEADQAEAAAQEAAEQEAEWARISARLEAERELAELQAWVERLAGVLTAYLHRRRRRRGRAVELLADFLARYTAARTCARGRPPAALYAAIAILAVDSDWRSGRRAMPGRARSAWLAGCSSRAVHSAWKLAVALKWAKRTRRGGRNSLARREETGRGCDRAEFDIVPLHRSTIDASTRAAYVPTALRVLQELLEYGHNLVQTAQAALDETAGPNPTTRTRQARMRAAVARANQAVDNAVDSALVVARTDPNICHTHTVWLGECVNSCSDLGLDLSFSINSPSVRQPPDGGKVIGASRSPTSTAVGDLDRLSSLTSTHLQDHHRTLQERGRRSPARRPRPAWSGWAYRLGDGLVGLWPWLRPVPRRWLAATLGARLGPDWTPPAVVGWLTRQHGRPLLDEPYAPLRYLIALLVEALTGDDTPPYPARLADEHRREQVRAVAAAQRARHDARRAELDANAAGATGAGRVAMHAEMARIRARQAGAAARDDAEPESWPPTARPGAGLPANWRHGADRPDTAC